MPKYQSTGRRPGRPRKHQTPVVCVGTRIPQSLYEQLAETAAQQACTITDCVEATLRKGLEHPRLNNDFDRAMLILADIEEGFATCPQCAAKIETLVSAAWDELIHRVSKEDKP
jgi:hypothetical protein